MQAKPQSAERMAPGVDRPDTADINPIAAASRFALGGFAGDQTR
jgi:hypothetical protein